MTDYFVDHNGELVCCSDRAEMMKKIYMLIVNVPDDHDVEIAVKHFPKSIFNQSGGDQSG